MSDDAPDIPPAGIRLIREVRRETRDELADRLNVSPKTIGNWERGDQPPSDENREALVDAIPPELSIDDVLEADDRLDDESRAYDNERRLFGSKWLQTLREQPRVADELGDGRGVSVLSGQQRMFVERLDLTGVEGAGQRDGERVTTVYYLPGDERRALRRFTRRTRRSFATSSKRRRTGSATSGTSGSTVFSKRNSGSGSTVTGVKLPHSRLSAPI